MGVSEIYGSGPAEPAEKLQKFRIGWTRRAATKTTNIRHLLVVVVVVACGRPRGPLRGQTVLIKVRILRSSEKYRLGRSQEKIPVRIVLVVQLTAARVKPRIF